MKRVVLGTKETSDGVFWIVEGELLAYPFGSVSTLDGVAKSGNTYNHKRLWNDIKPKGSKYTYNYYPRGRVVIDSQGRPTVYMNPNIDESFIKDIKIEFGLRTEPRIIYDNSNHYRCYLDDGWAPER